jgi:hypothetical protein
MSSLDPTVIQTIPADSPAVDAFGRFRQSKPKMLFESKHLFDSGSDFWNEDFAVGGAITYLSDESSVQMSTNGTNGSYAIRRSSRYFTYVSGQSHLIDLTTIFGASTANVTKRAGYFDHLNGVYFEDDGADLKFVIRSDASGSAVENEILQSAWNKDKLDGTGPSKLTLDITKSQILSFDIQWLGAGRVRFYLNIGGISIICHEESHSNELDIVYMRTPTLPVSYEIRDFGSTTGDSIKQICSAVYTEGEGTPLGFEFTATNGLLARTVPVTSPVTEKHAITPILVMRLKNTFKSKENRRTAHFNHATFKAVGKDVLFQVAQVRGITSIDANWEDIDTAESGIEQAVENAGQTGPIVIVGGDIHRFTSDFIVAGAKGDSTDSSTSETSKHSFISQNLDSTNSELFVVYANAESTTSDVQSTIDFTEFE